MLGKRPRMAVLTASSTNDSLFTQETSAVSYISTTSFSVPRYARQHYIPGTVIKTNAGTYTRVVSATWNATITTVVVQDAICFSGMLVWYIPSGGNDCYTAALWHGDGSNNGTSFPDSGATALGTGRPLTVQATFVTSTTQAKFGATSLKCGGVGCGYNSSPVNFLAGDFTVDFWAYKTVANDNGAAFISTSYNTAVTPKPFNCGDTGTVVYGVLLTGSGSYQATVPTMSLNTWTHIEFCRYGNILVGFKDGVKGTPVTVAGDAIAESYLTLGGYYGNLWYYSSCYIDEFRLSRVARHTENFTPPTAPYC